MPRHKYPKTSKCHIDMGHVTNTLDRLAVAVGHHTVPISFTMDDLLEIFLPSSVLKTLKAAYPYLNPTYWTKTNVNWGFSGREMGVVHLDLCATGMPIWAPNAISINREHPKYNVVNNTFAALVDIAAQFDDIKDVVTWLDQNASLGAARYYFPALCSLLPTNHPIHKLDGGRFANIGVPGLMVGKMRRASMTMANSILCPPFENPYSHTTISFTASRVDFPLAGIKKAT